MGDFPTPAGTPAGSGCIWFSNTAPSGWAILDGSTLTGAQSKHPELWANIDPAWKSGSDIVLPDCRGRMPIGKGTHADVDTLNKNDGVAVASRRAKHAHTNGLTFAGTNANTGTESADHVHNENVTTTGSGTGSQMPRAILDSGAGYQSSGANTGGRSAAHTHNYTPSGTIGGSIGAAGMTDSGGFIVVNWIIKLY
jgi:hypothetical protein